MRKKKENFRHCFVSYTWKVAVTQQFFISDKITTPQKSFNHVLHLTLKHTPTHTPDKYLDKGKWSYDGSFPLQTFSDKWFWWGGPNILQRQSLWVEVGWSGTLLLSSGLKNKQYHWEFTKKMSTGSLWS